MHARLGPPDHARNVSTTEAHTCTAFTQLVPQNGVTQRASAGHPNNGSSTPYQKRGAHPSAATASLRRDRNERGSIRVASYGASGQRERNNREIGRRSAI